jgi:uncharacterized membrane protein
MVHGRIKKIGESMRSKIRIAGHPVHAMLVGFPVAFYTTTLASFITYQINGDPFWFRVGYTANIAGVVMAVCAAVPGFLDWLLAVPRGTQARRTGLVHMALQIFALLAFALNAAMQYGKWYDVTPDASGAVFFSVVGFAFVGAGAFFGYSLVQRHHIGVEERPITENRLDRAG